MNQEHRPIIIKRKKVVHKHHGGSWKIALADFMTALMALFLVMWILSVASEEERASVAEYFRTPLTVAMTGGDRDTAAATAIQGGGPDPSHSAGEQQRIDLRQQTRPSDVRRHFENVQRRVQRAMRDDPVLQELMDQLRMDITREGLRIMVIDTERRPMFEIGSATVAPYMSRLLQTLAPILNEVPNRLTISGHTDSIPYSGGEKGYSNWELSVDRANASRIELLRGGFESPQLLHIAGMADRIPMDGLAPDHPQNRRITLVLHTSESADFIKRQGFYQEDQEEMERLRQLEEAQRLLEELEGGDDEGEE